MNNVFNQLSFKPSSQINQIRLFVLKKLFIIHCLLSIQSETIDTIKVLTKGFIRRRSVHPRYRHIQQAQVNG